MARDLLCGTAVGANSLPGGAPEEWTARVCFGCSAIQGWLQCGRPSKRGQQVQIMDDGRVIEHWIYKFTGATILEVEPMEVTHIQFGDSPIVFYGINGAGKTRVARSLTEALRGKSSGLNKVILHGEAHADSMDWRAYDLMTNGISFAHQEAYRHVGGPVPFDIDFSPTIGEILHKHVSLRRMQDDLSGHVWDIVEKEVRELEGKETLPVAVLYNSVDTFGGLYFAADMAEGAPMRTLFLGESSPYQGEPGPHEPLFGSPNIEGDETGVMHELSNALYDSARRSRSDARWPTSACLPVMRIGDFENPLQHVIEVNELDSWPDIDTSTTAMLTTWPLDNLIEAQLDGEVAYDASVLERIATLAATAQEIVATLLPQPLSLHFDLGQPSAWLRGSRPTWAVKVDGKALPLSELSWAERRWYTFGLALALATVESRGTWHAVVTFIDEPERGLHRAAEARLPHLLRHLEALGITCFVATHSPTLLNDPAADIHHVQRNQLTGKSELRSITGLGGSEIDRAAISEAMGLTPADLYQLTRLFVCVEGEHDLAVIETLLGEDLDESFAKLIPLRGAKGLRHLAAVPFLFDFTDANVLVVLDNLGEVGRAWADLQEASAAGDQRTAERASAKMRRFEGGEGTWLAEFAEHAIKRGVLHRVQVYGLREPDVICYLPPTAFLNDTSVTWPELLRQWHLEETGRSRRDLKTWLRETRRARITTASIRKAAESQVGENIPEELVGLGLKMRELGTWNRLSR